MDREEKKERKGKERNGKDRSLSGSLLYKEELCYAGGLITLLCCAVLCFALLCFALGA